ncbi:hypothetical protein [Vibrio spartinae]|uniref:Uncharacterized protein n=1 Tax=Vibrio spartinae TaxID=1918945 RepID=A0A1N6M7S2_9VIBR|nr:hypothetical protein [Vibrio spartinae]SIO95396.1 hypothetical protein VSP9026_03139 [Vibrio spartinae]
MIKNNNVSDEYLVDPEPFSIFLGVAGFLGSVASLAGYIEFKRDQRRFFEQQRGKTLFEARDYLMSLEADIMQIEASLRKLEFILVEGTSTNQSLPLSQLRLEFGTCKPLFTLHGFRKFEETMQELNRLVGKSFDTTSQLFQRLYNLDVRIPKEVYRNLLDIQCRLNKVLRNDLTYEEGFNVYYELIIFTRSVIRNVRTEISRTM